MKIALGIIAVIIAFAIIVPLLHLLGAVLVIAGGAILVMAAWKVLFGVPAPTQGRGGPPAVS